VNKASIIRGGGLVTPLGGDLSATWLSLLHGDVITDHARCPIKSLPGMDRVSQLAITAAQSAVRQAAWSATDLQSDRTALIVGTSKGSIDAWLTAPPVHFTPTSDNPFNRDFRLPGLHTVANAIAGHFRLGHGIKLTLSSACATGLLAFIRAAMLLEQGDADRVIVVAAESSLHPLLLQSYKRLGVLAAPGELIRPMDENRSGFFVSEAAAAICLERAFPRPGDVMIDRYAQGSDATHITGVDPAGQTLRNCLARCHGEGAVNFIHAHGTATVLNDPVELSALDDEASDWKRPLVYSHKAAVGHSMGAAGLISVVLNTEIHRKGVIPPNASTLNPLFTRHVEISSQSQHRQVKHSLCVAAGFGGPTAVLRLNTVQ
jgi:3-oxoacyl-[acyl-carrier-protein] synthase II